MNSKIRNGVSGLEKQSFSKNKVLESPKNSPRDFL